MNLKRTADAIELYDKVEADRARMVELVAKGGGNTDALIDLDRELVDLEEAVGAAYGEDTKAFNDPETCRKLIRPGPKIPPLGAEESFVRRMVRLWRKEGQP